MQSSFRANTPTVIINTSVNTDTVSNIIIPSLKYFEKTVCVWICGETHTHTYTHEAGSMWFYVCLLSLHTGQCVCIPTHGSVTSACTAFCLFVKLSSSGGGGGSSSSRCAARSWIEALRQTVSENRWIDTCDRWGGWILRRGWWTNKARQTKDEQCGWQWMMRQECWEAVYCTYATVKR